MRKAYDTILQSEVSADLAAQSSGFEPYRYECACCGEDVYIAAARSNSIVTHFRHRSGNNDVECENYLGKYGAIDINPRSRKSNRERAEFYFEKSTKTFRIGLCFSSDEINAYASKNTVFEIRASTTERAFASLPINLSNFAPDIPTMIPITKFSISYFLSNTLNGIQRSYDLFKFGYTPTFFKLHGNHIDFKARLVRGEVLFTNISYFVVFQSQMPHRFFNIQEIHVEETLCFDTMGKKFLGNVITIKSRNYQVDALFMSWGYRLEDSETLTLLWPPAALIDDVSVIASCYAFLYSSFELQAHGNINIHTDDIHRVDSGVSKVTVKAKTKVFKKNAEIIINKCEQYHDGIDVIPTTERTTDKYTVPDDSTYFIFNSYGVKRLDKGQSILLTPQAEIRHYYYGYLKDRIYTRRQEEMTGEHLLINILSHYRRTEVFDKCAFSSFVLSETASQYIHMCESTGLINSVAKKYIEEGWL